MNNNTRPQNFQDFIGNTGVKEQLKISVEACKKNNRVFGHTLFYGNPGLGKTTLSNILAAELGYTIFSIVGSSMKSEADLFVLLVSIEQAQREKPVILFIDEIHTIGLSQELPQTIYYPLLEDFTLFSNLKDKIVIIDGEEHRVTENVCQISPFTVIGATTDPADLDDPLRDRFAHQLFLKPYSEDDLSLIVSNYCRRVNIKIDEVATLEIAKRARFTPRIALSYLKNCEDMATYKDSDKITKEIVAEQMELMGVDSIGLKEEDVKVLQTLRDSKKGLGIASLAGTVGIKKEIITSMIEPFLKQKGLMATTNCQIITEKGIKYLEEKNEESKF